MGWVIYFSNFRGESSSTLRIFAGHLFQQLSWRGALAIYKIPFLVSPFPFVIYSFPLLSPIILVMQLSSLVNLV